MTELEFESLKAVKLKKLFKKHQRECQDILSMKKSEVTLCSECSKREKCDLSWKWDIRESEDPATENISFSRCGEFEEEK